MFHGHDLAAEQDLVQVFRHAVGEAVQGGDDAQGRDGPYGCGYLLIAEVVQKSCGNGKQTLWDDFHR